MKITHYSECDGVLFDSEAVKGVTGRVAIGQADGAKNFCMRVFELEEGGYSPRHSHEWEHEIFVHSGKGEILNKDKWVPISTGYIVFVPGNLVHQIRNVGDEPFVFACLIPVGAPEL